MGDLTAANAVITITQPILFSQPQQLQGFQADDVFDLEQIENIETVMGVDGVMSYGFVWKVQPQTIHLQADSPSNAIFDVIQTQQIAAQTAYPMNGVISLPAMKLKIILTNGVLSAYKLPGAKKLVTPRNYRITWNLAVPAPQ
jgi:hypothetical protein